MRPAYDDSAWPIAVLTPAEKKDLPGDIAFVRSLLARREVFALILDVRHAALLDARERSLWTTALGELEPLIRRYGAGVAFVVTSALMRGTITAVLWMKPLPIPHVVEAELEPARAWCEKILLERRGGESPPR